MDALSQILAALSVKSYTATGVRGGGFSIAYPAYPGMKLLVPRKGKMYFLKTGNPAPDSALRDAGHASAGSSALSEAQSTPDWIELLPGSFLLMVEPTGFIFTDDPKLEPHPSAQTPYELRSGLADYGIKLGYEENILLAGKMTLDPTAAAQLRAALPPLLILKPNDNEADRLGWMMKMLHEEVESSGPGSSLVTTHLMQLVLIEVIRCWIHSPEAKNHPGIFLALRQPTLFRALSAIHNAPKNLGRSKPLPAPQVCLARALPNFLEKASARRRSPTSPNGASRQPVSSCVTPTSPSKKRPPDLDFPLQPYLPLSSSALWE